MKTYNNEYLNGLDLQVNENGYEELGIIEGFVISVYHDCKHSDYSNLTFKHLNFFRPTSFEEFTNTLNKAGVNEFIVTGDSQTTIQTLNELEKYYGWKKDGKEEVSYKEYGFGTRKVNGIKMVRA